MKLVVSAAFRSSLLLAILAAFALLLAGCSTSDPEHQSSRPSGAPKGWETGGLPSSMTEGR